MKPRGSRIASWVVFLLFVVGLLVWQWVANQPAALPPSAARTPFPVFDIAEPSARRTAVWLMRGERNQVDGEWLGSACREHLASSETPHDTFVMTRAGPGRNGWRNGRLLVTWNGLSGQAQRTEWLDYDTIGEQQTVRLDDEDMDAFERVLLDGVFLRVPPGDRVGSCHTEAITMEWCSKARYYGVMRVCEVYQEQPVTDLADSIEAFVAQRAQPGR